MSGVITVLEPVLPPPPGWTPPDNSAHPMRAVTESILDETGWWTSARAAEVGAFFDDIAPQWDQRFADDPQRVAPLVDALDRGGRFDTAGLCVDLGCGTGGFTAVLTGRFPHVLAVDLAAGMLARVPVVGGWPVLADGARLPVRDGAVAALVLVNMFLFPEEVDRVLEPTGALVWVNSRGEGTPIHLSNDRLLAALPGVWAGVDAPASTGSWTVLRRGRSD